MSKDELRAEYESQFEKDDRGLIHYASWLESKVIESHRDNEKLRDDSKRVQALNSYLDSIGTPIYINEDKKYSFVGRVIKAINPYQYYNP